MQCTRRPVGKLLVIELSGRASCSHVPSALSGAALSSCPPYAAYHLRLYQPYFSSSHWTTLSFTTQCFYNPCSCIIFFLQGSNPSELFSSCLTVPLPLPSLFCPQWTGQIFFFYFLVEQQLKQLHANQTHSQSFSNDVVSVENKWSLCNLLADRHRTTGWD